MGKLRLIWGPKYFCVSCGRGLKDSKHHGVSRGQALPGGASTSPGQRRDLRLPHHRLPRYVCGFSASRTFSTHLLNWAAYRAEHLLWGSHQGVGTTQEPTKALVALQQKKFKCHSITRDNLVLGRLQRSRARLQLDRSV